MRRHATKALIGFLAVIIGVVGVVLAANPHFIKASANRQGNNLVVDFKIVGLGDNQSVTITASATATAVYECVNRGGKNPEAANKEEVSADVSVSGDFTSGKNGSVSGSLTISPPPPTLVCPSGQRLVLVSVTYENVSVSSEDDTETIDGTF